MCDAAGQVCNALACVTSQCPSAQQACSGAVSDVASLLSHPDPAVVEQACQAVASLTANCPEHQSAAAQAGAVDGLMQLLLKAPPDSTCSLQQWRQGLLHLALAVLLVTADVRTSSPCLSMPVQCCRLPTVLLNRYRLVSQKQSKTFSSSVDMQVDERLCVMAEQGLEAKHSAILCCWNK